MIRILGASLLLAAAATALGSTQGPKALRDAIAAYERLSDDSVEARDPKTWRRVGEALRRGASARSAEGAEGAEEAAYRAGLCFEKAFSLSGDGADREQAGQAYEAVSGAFGGSPVADDALLRSGRLLETEGRFDEARARYERLLREHPEGDVAPLARRRLKELGKPSEITGIRSWAGAGYTRVVVDFSGSGVYSAGVLRDNPAAGKPYRVFLDFGEARLSAGCAGCVAVGDGLLTQVRAARFDPRTIRVVLDLQGPSSFRVFRLDAPSRVVVDLFRKGEAVASTPKKTEGSGKTEGPAQSASSRPPVRIVIDPGHGGIDPGALGPGGAREKDVVLAVAKELGLRLKKSLRCDLRFTREDDRTVSLEERTAIANAFGADLFVSIHANASRSSEARGTETYYLARASDRAARALAARENASGEEGVSEIEHILADVLLSSKVGESRRLAEALQQALVAELRRDYDSVKDLGVKRAPFYVLTGAAMPAVLVETAFISHSEESRRLQNPAYRGRTAQALASGLVRYVNGGLSPARKKG